jgi:hypothetical protein
MTTTPQFGVPADHRMDDTMTSCPLDPERSAARDRELESITLDR